MAASVLEIDSTDVDDYILARSLKIKFNSMDVTLVDPPFEPALQDDIVVVSPAWTGKVKGVATSTYRDGAGTDHRYLKITGKNFQTISDDGTVFDLSDNPNLSTTFPWKDKTLTVHRTRSQGVNEVRAKVTILKHGLWPGMEVDITSAAEGFTAETFTIMDVTVSYPTDDLTKPEYALDLGLGEFATATTGAAGGGSLGPTALGNDDCCCCPPWDGSGTPSSGQQVIFEYIADGDDSTTAYATDYGYQAGTLRVYFNSVNVTSTKTEDDPGAGDFSVSTAPASSPLQKVYATYYAA